jgi:hypothetical protein
MRQMFTISEDGSLQITEAGHAGLNAFEHVGEPCHRLDVVEFGDLNELCRP